MEEVLIQSEYEIERGKPMPSKNHAIVQKRLLVQLDAHFGERYEVLPEINLGLPVRERIPDLAIYQTVEFTPGQDEIRMTQIPLGVIEILSPQQSLDDLMQKRTEYFAAGVQSYWMVLPDLMTVYVFYSADDYDIFSRKDRLIDKKLNIQVNLGEVFK